MSDAAIEGPGPERRRAFASILVAVALHAGILAVVTLAAGLGLPLPAVTQTVIDVQLDSEPAPAEPFAAEPAPDAAEPAPGGQPSEAPSLSPTAAAAPAAASKPVAAAAVKAPTPGAGVASNGDYVIPTPRGQAATALPASRGAAFQESGVKTGVAASLPAAQSPLPQPDAAVVPQVRGGSTATSPAGTLQRGGVGTPLHGQSGKGSTETLDLGQLDKSIAAGAGGNGGAAATKGGSGGGQAGSAGGLAGAGGSGTGNYGVAWVQPDASRGRKLAREVKPKIPPWVSAQGLTLSVKVAFTLTPAGVIMDPKVTQSTGYPDVDSAVVDAIRHCLFNSTTSTATVKGVFTYVVKPQ